MGRFVFFIIILVVTAGNNQKSLEDKIYNAQRMCLKSSPLKSARYFISEIETQKEFRGEYLKDILQSRKQKPNDTIIIIERHRFECDGCPAYFVGVNFHKEYIKYSMAMNGTKFTHYTSEKIKKIHEFVTPDAYYKDGYLHKDLKMIMESLRERKKINVGAEDCFDGSKTMYTIIFPNDKIDCFYVRCSIN